MTSTCTVEPGRRKFLQQMGAGAVLLATSSWSTENTGEASSEDEWAILIDTTRCTGCQSCALACKVINELPNPTEPPSRLGDDAYSFVDARQVAPEVGAGDESKAAGEESVTYVKRQCMHCLHPACVSACTVGALRKTASGPVVYDADKCIGCRYCQYACPFGVPAYGWDETLGLISKCQMCAQRLTEGQAPACVSACPNGALRLGKRVELLAQAHAQITSNPGRYVDHIYGEHEAGGTSVLYLSATPFAKLGFPTLGFEAAPEQAEFVMTSTPIVALSVAALATSLYWLTRLRTSHKAHESIELDDE